MPLSLAVVLLSNQSLLLTGIVEALYNVNICNNKFNYLLNSGLYHTVYARSNKPLGVQGFISYIITLPIFGILRLQTDVKYLSVVSKGMLERWFRDYVKMLRHVFDTCSSDLDFSNTKLGICIIIITASVLL